MRTCGLSQTEALQKDALILFMVESNRTPTFLSTLLLK